MQPKYLLPVLCSFFLATVGCSSADDDSVAGPPPSEPTVFVASAQTTSALGIVKWGFATDDTGNNATYRGYGAKNEVLATVEQKLAQADDTHWNFTMTASGPSWATASENIEFKTQPSDDGTQTLLIETLTATSFQDGDTPSHVLAAFQTDADNRTSTTVGSGSLTGQSVHPLDGTGQQLVTNCNQTTSCLQELIDARIAASSLASSCSLMNRVGIPLVAGVVGALVGGFVTLETGPGAAVGAAAGAAGGYTSSAASAAINCASSRSSNAQAQQKLQQCQQQAAMSCNGGS